MKTASEIEQALSEHKARQQQLLAELNAEGGAIQALQWMLENSEVEQEANEDDASSSAAADDPAE